ncbi:hypothetical protein RF11_00977 [Thelohanellus kitauei]|uniref:Uncharacterized protein n=1 Tax=Thelohanellus kitauei TaxID=669202 RepID=A0A0C2JD11_THEKT|nr:hypothetical protein RF11_00977 [Thelohanellus kitauei]
MKPGMNFRDVYSEQWTDILKLVAKNMDMAATEVLDAFCYMERMSGKPIGISYIARSIYLINTELHKLTKNVVDMRNKGDTTSADYIQKRSQAFTVRNALLKLMIKTFSDTKIFLSDDTFTLERRVIDYEIPSDEISEAILLCAEDAYIDNEEIWRERRIDDVDGKILVDATMFIFK